MVRAILNRRANIGESNNVVKLHSIAQLHGMFPEAEQKNLTIAELGKVVEQLGTYRQVGKKVRVMTDSDVRNFFHRLSAQQPSTSLEPMPTESGLVVVIGDRAGTDDSLMYIHWCESGGEFAEVERVQQYVDGAMGLILTHDMMYGDFVQWREVQRKTKDWSHGRWHYRTASVMKVFQTDEEKGA